MACRLLLPHRGHITPVFGSAFVFIVPPGDGIKGGGASGEVFVLGVVCCVNVVFSTFSSCGVGQPQFGQAAALSEYSFPHSVHLINAINITFLSAALRLFFIYVNILSENGNIGKLELTFLIY